VHIRTFIAELFRIAKNIGNQLKVHKQQIEVIVHTMEV
jgi:hypothetical protein